MRPLVSLGWMQAPKVAHTKCGNSFRSILHCITLRSILNLKTLSPQKNSSDLVGNLKIISYRIPQLFLEVVSPKFRSLNASISRQFFLIFAFSTKNFGFESCHKSFLLVATGNSKSQYVG